MKVAYTTSGPRETGALARALAEEVLRTNFPPGALVVGLVGELGAGKTTFIRSFIRALGVQKKITSPTFLITRRYPLSSGGSLRGVFHIDAYRIKSAKELPAAGITDALGAAGNVVLIEWADKIEKLLPRGAVRITFSYGKTENERHITISRR